MYRTVGKIALLLLLVASGVALALIAALGWRLYSSSASDPVARYTLGSALIGGALVSGAIFLGTLAWAAQSARSERRAKLRELLNSSTQLSGVDMMDCDMTGMYLRGRDFHDARLSWSKLVKADCYGSNFSGADLIRAKLQEANLGGAMFVGANLSRVRGRGAALGMTDFTMARLVGAKFRDCLAMGCIYRGANLDRSSFYLTRMIGSQFGSEQGTRTTLRGARLRSAILWGCDFRDSDCSGARFTRASFSPWFPQLANVGASQRVSHRPLRNFISLVNGDATRKVMRLTEPMFEQLVVGRRTSGEHVLMAITDFARANLRNTHMQRCDLEWVNFVGADLSGADLRGSNVSCADFSGCDLSKTILNGVKYCENTCWPADFVPEARGAVRAKSTFEYTPGSDVSVSDLLLQLSAGGEPQGYGTAAKGTAPASQRPGGKASRRARKR
jgi:uncharacterized protein YjbI with pentapeptide repeats